MRPSSGSGGNLSPELGALSFALAMTGWVTGPHTEAQIHTGSRKSWIIRYSLFASSVVFRC